MANGNTKRMLDLRKWLRILQTILLVGNIPAPDLDGGSGGGGDTGDGTPDGGGQPGTPTGSSQSAALPFAENGGVFGTTYFLFIPVQDIVTGRCYIGTYDINSFDDEVDGSSYSYRAEDVIKNCVVTVNRIWLTIRDLGCAKLTLNVSGTSYDAKPVSATVTQKVGNKIPTGTLLTYRVDLQATCYRPQLTISRAAAGGPVCITEVTMAGEVDEGG